MSYCRWSTNFGQCDVYVYEDVHGGWRTHVAGRRLKHLPPPALVAMPYETVEQIMALHEATKAWRDSLPSDEHPCIYQEADGTRRPGTYRAPKDSEYIDLRELGPEAGQSYNDPTPGDCADRLEALRAGGFLVPQHAIDTLREDERERCMVPPREDA